MRAQNRNFKLKIKDVRCFAGEQIFDIRPLTFLIGRNSTGKTTVMSCFSIIYDFISQGSWYHPDFNKEPYDMGSFTDIVRKLSKKRGAKKNKTSFEIGIIFDNPQINYSIQFKEKDKGAEPVVSQVNIDFKTFLLSLQKQKGNLVYIVKSQKTGKSKPIGLATKFLTDNTLPRGIGVNTKFLKGNILSIAIEPRFEFDLSRPMYFLKNAFSKKEDAELFQKWHDLNSFHKQLSEDKIFSMAPVRSKPQRTYNPIKESPSPEGVEIPVYLANLSNQKTIWKDIHKKLVDFGKASGLFSNIKVRKEFRKTKGGPFQLQFQIEGIESNIIDTGYGLSQVLPLLVRLFASDISRFQDRWGKSKRTRFLLQQPEVHLHPSAQAELASLFVKSVTKTKHSFLIETHSDYMLDRTRIEIRKGSISPNDVSFIYLESVKEGVKAHNMSIDKQGNLNRVPASYRRFFIKESNRFLGFER